MIANYIEVLKKYVVFTGRARRREYWLFILANLIIGFVLGFILGLAGIPEAANVAGGVYNLAVLLPTIAVGIRRLHDTGRSGWFYLLILVPLVNIILIVWFCQDSDRNANEYGACPK
ncbi:MAG: DUF805 domain-containing protein [Planctomycetaceae bacterium]|jgi:uncharacterized membrane protein YhaH (DUF805 family)|nr:DUF805 domain-containing protein [Planctomycetaceae bacterium]